MKIDVFFTPATAEPKLLKNRTAVVIDVLRASSSIITALVNGAEEVIPAPSVPDAFKKLRAKKNKALLCGERGGHRVKGFHLGNSPLEFTPDTVAGRTLVMAATNGSVAVCRTKSAKPVYIASLLNIESVAEKLAAQKRDIAVICSGKEGRFSLEDSVCAGMLIFLIEKRKHRLELSDTAMAACSLYKDWLLDLEQMLTVAEHGRYLARVGHKKDLAACAHVNQYTIVPVLRKGSIVKE
jgi:2-phosphosulfolactate phosphatase